MPSFAVVISSVEVEIPSSSAQGQSGCVTITITVITVSTSGLKGTLGCRMFWLAADAAHDEPVAFVLNECQSILCVPRRK
jgi:hypothetical protein